MRKLYLYVALLSLTLAAGCQREEIVFVESENDVMEVYATIENLDDAQTKTYLSGTEIYWSSGDKIAVFMGNTLRKRFDVTPESIDSKDATFQYDSQYIITGKNSDISHNVAYYPFSDVTCAADGSSYTLSNLTLPVTQTYVKGSVGLGAFPMVAVTENTADVDFCFLNICGVMQFQLTGYGFVKSVSVRGNNEEVLTGSAVVTAGYGKEPSIAMSAEGGKEVTLDCGESGVELNETTPTSFFIVLPPVQFEGGFTITVTDTWGGSREYSTTKKNPVNRSKGLKMPPKEYVGERPVQEGDYVDEYGVNHGQGVEIDGVVWAPVNCGYHKDDFKYGKLYQWGRKYGQGYSGDLYDVNGSNVGTYSDATLPTIEEGGVSVITGNHKSKENIFYTSTSDYNLDWVYPQDDKLWNSGTEDNPVKTEYDPCPEGWRVPTYAELNELCSNKSSWTTDSNGQVGYWFSGASSYTSEVPQVFFPAAGYRLGNDVDVDVDVYSRGNFGHYWSSGPYYSGAYYLGFGSGYAYMSNDGRASGYPVRCVQDDSELIPVESVVLDQTYMIVYADPAEAFSLNATISPANATHQSVYWHSDNTSVVLPADDKGTMIAVSQGSATITAMAGMQTATCYVTVLPKPEPQEGDYIDEYGVNHGQGVEIDGVVWAPVNCGYHKDDFKYGKLYQWGRKYGQGYSGNIYDLDGDKLKETYSDAIVPTVVSGPVDLSTGQSNDNENIFYKDSSSPYDWLSNQNDQLWNSGTEDNPVKTEYDPCPDGWRVPTYAELNELRSNRSSWTTNSDGQIGYWFSGASTYTSDAPQVFFLAAGTHSYDGGSCSSRGDIGIYWSSRPYSTGAYNLRLLSSFVDMMYICRTYGFSVRCVQITD